MRRIQAFSLFMLCAATGSQAAQFELFWADQDPTTRIISLAAGEEADIAFRITLVAGETLSAAAYSNEEQGGVLQVSVTPVATGWEQSIVRNEPLGLNNQYASVAAPGEAQNLTGPGQFLLGTQRIRLTDGGDGSDIEIAINMDYLVIINAAGGFFNIVTSDNPSANSAGVVHVAGGSPGYTVGARTDTRDPLIIQVASSGGGGGGGGGGTDGGGTDGGGTDDGGTDGGGTNDGGVDGGGTDGGGTDDGGVDDGGTNDGGTDDGGVDDGGTDNGGTDDGGTNGGGTDDGGTDDGGTDDGGTDDGGADNGGNNNGGQPTNSGGICGSGAAAMVTFSLLGLAGLHERRRFRA